MTSFAQVGVEAQVKGFSAFMGNLGKMDKGISTFGKTSSNVAKGGIATLGAGIATVGATAGAAAVGGIAALGAGLAALGAASVKEGAAYSKQMSNVKALTSATAIEFDKLSDSAENLGATTKFTATEVAEGMGFLAMAGFEVNKIIGAMPAVLDLAAAGNLDLATSADIASNILTGFNMDVSQSNRVMDILAATMTTANIDLVQLGQGMKFVAPVAATLGQDIEDVSAAMGALADAGIQGEMGGTSLRAGLLKLTSPSKEAGKLIKTLGLEIFDLEGNMLPLPKIIGNIEKATGKMTQQQKAQTLETIFGVRNVAAFNVLLTKGETALQSYGNELRNSGGTAARIAAEQLNNLSGDVTLLKSAFSGIKIEIFKTLEPLLRSIAKTGKVLLEAYGPSLQSAFGAIAQAGSSIFETFNKAFGAFEKFGARGVVISFLGQLGLEPSQISTALAVIDEIIISIEGFFTKIQTLITSFSTGGAGGVLASLFNVATVEEAFGIILAKIPELLQGLITSITSFLSTQGPVIGETLRGWATNFWGWVNDVVAGAGAALAAVTIAIGAWVASDAGQGQILLLGNQLGQALVDGISFFLDNQEQFTIVMTKVALGLGAAALAITGMLVVVAGQIVAGFIAGLVEKLGGGELEVATFNELSTVFEGIASNFMTIATFVADRIGEDLAVAVANIIPTLIDVFGEEFVAVGAGMIDGLIVGIQGKLTELGTTISQIGFIITQTVKDALGIASPSTVFLDIGLNIIQGLIQGITQAAGELPGLLSGIIGGLFDGGDSGGGGIGEMFTFDPATMIEGLLQVKTSFTEISALVLSIGSELVPVLMAALVTAAQTAIPVWTAVNNAITMLGELFTLMYTVTLIELQSVTSAVTQAMGAGFSQVSAIVLNLISLVTQLIAKIIQLTAEIIQLTAKIILLGASFAQLGKKATAAAAQIVSAFSKMKSEAEKSKGVIKQLTEAWKKLADAANAAAKASVSAAGAAKSSGAGGGKKAKHGLGFAGGTAGFKVPSGFPNDTFPINVTSGEHVVVAPVGKTISDVISAGSTTINNISISIANNNGSGFGSDAQMAQSVRMNIARALT